MISSIFCFSEKATATVEQQMAGRPQTLAGLILFLSLLSFSFFFPLLSYPLAQGVDKDRDINIERFPFRIYSCISLTDFIRSALTYALI